MRGNASLKFWDSGLAHDTGKPNGKEHKYRVSIEKFKGELCSVAAETVHMIEIYLRYSPP